MALYMIGDVQGCDDALARLLAHIGFSASRDTLYLLGDLVNRGPRSLAVLRRVMALDGAARCVLGNHDLHLLAVAPGARRAHRSDTLQAGQDAPHRGRACAGGGRVSGHWTWPWSCRRCGWGRGGRTS